ncbi:GFA family protein [Salipiger mucosus]|uniref:CENP-V/GFA domain-containing protein n=1 Tax=Salipiger mucosus DSM 16094 TaxID=1123237 RepID=S9Q3P0_9RHOB|nr:GFA family protein [Salipiger mucosus]EPX75946.1 hypothetical protein Salmuc_02342 [Salipiger mucosus DSM 16094]
MPMTLEGSCRCGAVAFTVQSHTPVPYQRCYCSICRKTAGGGGYAINLGALADTLTVSGWDWVEVYRAKIHRSGACEVSTGERHYCKGCATALWLYDPSWPELLHPFASAIDTDLPEAPERVHLMLAGKPAWVPLPEGPGEVHFDEYPELSLDDWHRTHGLWVA